MNNTEQPSAAGKVSPDDLKWIASYSAFKGGIVPLDNLLTAYHSDQAKIKALTEVLESAIKSVEFESHPFRPWHDKARAELSLAKS